MQNYTVIVVGGGYAGLSFIHNLKKNSYVKLILIDKQKHHLLQTHIHKYLSGYYNSSELLVSYDGYCKNNNIQFICDEVVKTDFKKNKLFTASSEFSYDYLIMAQGAVSFFPKQIKNLAKYSKDVKILEELDYYREKFLKICDEARKENKSITIIGGGISGLQIACEYVTSLRKKNLQDRVKVTIIEGMKTLLPGMHKNLIKAAKKRCKELNIDVKLGAFVVEIDKKTIVLSNGETLYYDLNLSLIGIECKVIEDENNDLIKRNTRNQIIVDDYYKITPYKNAFALGDVAQAIDIKSKHFQLPTAQAARLQAELTAKNISRDIDKKILIKNNIYNRGILIDLSDSKVIGRIINTPISGWLANKLKKFVYKGHLKKFI